MTENLENLNLDMDMANVNMELSFVDVDDVIDVNERLLQKMFLRKMTKMLSK